MLTDNPIPSLHTVLTNGIQTYGRSISTVNSCGYRVSA